MGIKTFANWLVELEIKFIHKHGNQCISQEDKGRKFLNYPMCTGIRFLSLPHTPKAVIAKNNYKGKSKAKPQSTEELDYSKVWVKVKGHPALALVDL